MSRRNVIVAVSGVVLVLAAWYMLLWSPKGAELTEATTRRDAATAKVAELENRLRSLVAVAERRDDLDARLAHLSHAVPDEPELASFLLDVDRVAARSGVAFMSVTPARPAEATGGLPPSVAVGITVKGGYFNVLDYLQQLMALDRVVVVDSVDVAPQGTGSSPELSVTLAARMFSLQSGSAAAATPISTSTASTSTGATK